VIEVSKVNEGYSVLATPPHVTAAWKSGEPRPIEELVAELRARGAHPTDIGDAFYAADPDWLERSG